jgi:periplasmic divalent cation tolerance protein
MRAAEARVVLVTAPDADAALALARALVEERLAACGNVVSPVTSVYRWQGAVHESGEALLVLKTSGERLADMSARIVELHPYDVPEVLALGVDDGYQPYLDWLGDCLSPGGRSDGSKA